MTSKIERVARAIRSALKDGEQFEGAARAALEATKGPTEEMIESACVADDHCTPPSVCESIFNAMIDAALHVP